MLLRVLDAKARLPHQAPMRANYKLQRLFVPGDLAAGMEIDADPQQSHYLAHVLRLGPGAQLLLFNGRDGEWSAAVSEVRKKVVRLTVDSLQRPQPAPCDLVYCFAPLKQARLDYLVQKAVEMGAGVLQPVLTQHTQVTKTGPDRLNANVIEAAEQCGILAVPKVREAVRLERLLSGWDRERRLIFCDERCGPSARSGWRCWSARKAASPKTNAACCGRSISSPPFRSGRAYCAPIRQRSPHSPSFRQRSATGRIRAPDRKGTPVSDYSDDLSTVRSSFVRPNGRRAI
jgi:16S rRNA (uracil1498-N3)-methyltransferase